MMHDDEQEDDVVIVLGGTCRQEGHVHDSALDWDGSFVDDGDCVAAAVGLVAPSLHRLCFVENEASLVGGDGNGSMPWVYSEEGAEAIEA